MFVGIVGVDAADSAPLALMAGALRGGGPARAWRDPAHRAAFAAASAGLLPEDRFDQQPYADEAAVFVCHARIDNRAELAARLGRAATEDVEMADAALFFLAFRRWGAECVHQVAGDFAFVAWDRASGGVVAGVDAFASRPLYYAEVEGRLVLGCQLGAVLAHPRVSKALDLDALLLASAPKGVAGATPYRAVRTVPGGQLLHSAGGTLRLTPWWRPDCSPRVRYRDPRDYAAHAGELFRCAVDAQLRATGPVVSTMSGGLDSTLVSATAATLLRKRGHTLTTFTSVPEPGIACAEQAGWEASDAAYVAAVTAAHENIDARFVTPGGRPPLDLVPALHAHSYSPVRNSANHLWLARVAVETRALGGRVVLVGERGNATISASGAGAVGELLWSGRWLAAARTAAALGRGERRAAWRLVGRGVLDGRRRRPSRRRYPGPAFWSAESRSRLLPQLADPHAGLTPGQTAVAFLIRPRMSWAADSLAQWGIEWRDPTADRRLVEGLLSFAPEAFVAGGRYRGLARGMALGLLPDVVRERRTRGAQVPELPGLIAVHAPRYRRALDAVAASPHSAAAFDLGRVRRALDVMAEEPRDLVMAATIDRVMDVALFIAARGTPA